MFLGNAQVNPEGSRMAEIAESPVQKQLSKQVVRGLTCYSNLLISVMF